MPSKSGAWGKQCFKQQNTIECYKHYTVVDKKYHSIIEMDHNAYWNFNLYDLTIKIMEKFPE